MNRNMKFTMLLSAALLTGVLSVPATTANVDATATNSNPEAAMTALFGDPAVAKAKGFQIKRSELDTVVSAARSSAAANGQQLPPEFPVTVLDQLITIQVLLQTATAADQAAGQQEAAEQYTNLLKKFISLEAFERQLEAEGMTVAQLRARATQEATAKAALKRELNAAVTEEEAKDYYNKHATLFELPERVHVRHILLLTIDPTTHLPLSTNTVASKRKQIEDLRKQILAGADFAETAKKYSEDPGSKENGGELPLFARASDDPYHAMVAEFESAAFALNTNEVSDVVTTQYGYHLIKMLDKTAAKKFGFTEPIPEADGDTPEQVCKTRVESQKLAKLAPGYIKKLRADQQVEILDASLKAADEQMQAAAAAAAAESVDGTNKAATP